LQAALFAVAAANAVTLQELRMIAPVEDMEALLRAAPQLRTLEADIDCKNAADAHRVPRNEPPFGPLRVRQLFLNASEVTADTIIELAAGLSAHASLTSVVLYDAALDAPAALDAVVDAVLERRLSSVTLTDCRLSPASAPALARLLGGDTLTELHVDNVDRQLLDEPAATLLANALRANTTLAALTLDSIQLWHDAAAAAELMDVLTAHPRLRLLDLSWNHPHDEGLQAAEAGAALGALLLANAPALRTFKIVDCGLGDAGLRPVVEALRHNTHLTTLDCRVNATSEAFARNRLLPAVRVNTSLRELNAGPSIPEREVEALVAQRV
jgi:hypothetical protein